MALEKREIAGAKSKSCAQTSQTGAAGVSIRSAAFVQRGPKKASKKSVKEEKKKDDESDVEMEEEEEKKSSKKAPKIGGKANSLFGN